MYHFKKSFSLVELIMVISIIGILATMGSWLMVFLVDNFINLPTSLNLNMIISDTLEIICEGDAKAGGLRFARDVLQSAANRVRFIDKDGNDILITGYHSQPVRSINSGSLELIPYYIPSSFTVVGKNGKAFEYYDRYGNITADPLQVKRVDIRLIATLQQKTKEVKTSVTIRGR